MEKSFDDYPQRNIKARKQSQFDNVSETKDEEDELSKKAFFYFQDNCDVMGMCSNVCLAVAKRKLVVLLFEELKRFYGIEDNRASVGPTGAQKLSSGLISIALKCVGTLIGEKPPVTKKLPPVTSVTVLAFNMLALHSRDSPMPILLEDDMPSLMDLGVGNEFNILMDEES
ncbi:tubulin-folding cofactor E isoform X3 [Cucumis melo var. makuwa]|uniref:Tubulin-folding cofactor E isoform X3 n=1 Tax=Cucumis melo var. makuwa TaxID=1194695 RepID=A0A5D3CSG8_CUCMM|nr:tubulin-folding cofactor E isoform X3 [Cucumis melo var. makuwa]